MTREVKFVLDVRAGSPNGSIVVALNLRSFSLRILSCTAERSNRPYIIYFEKIINEEHSSQLLTEAR